MKKYTFLLMAVIIAAFSSCKDKDADQNAELKTAVVQQYSNIVFANYSDTYSRTLAMKSAIDVFVGGPSPTSHQAAKDAWLLARESYGQTEAFRFSDGPIDDTDGPEGLLNAWPLDEIYIDYVVGSPLAGIVNDSSVTIDKATLETLNELGGERNISLGYHAVEFLLWGQDDADASLLTSGSRPFTDYIDGANGTAENQIRRGRFLQLAAEILLENLQSLVTEWEAGSTSNYRMTFESLDNDEALRRIFSGIGILSKSELAGERIFTALDNQSQEDEHSCFSDNTHRDIITNFLGIKNIYEGQYTRADGSVVVGASLKELAAEYDQTLTAEINDYVNNTWTYLNAIPVPFDHALGQENVGGSGPIQTAVNSLVTLGDKFAELAGKMDITISTALPE